MKELWTYRWRDKKWMLVYTNIGGLPYKPSEMMRNFRKYGYFNHSL